MMSSIGLRPELETFVKFMEIKLRQRDDRYGESWKEASLDGLTSHLKEEVWELHCELSNLKHTLSFLDKLDCLNQIVVESVDVANMAMYIASKALILVEELKTK
jgi:hypothetical protein